MVMIRIRIRVWISIGLGLRLEHDLFEEVSRVLAFSLEDEDAEEDERSWELLLRGPGSSS